MKILTDKSSGKRSLGRSRRKWQDYIRMDLKEIGVSSKNWIHSAQYSDYDIKPSDSINHGVSYYIPLLKVSIGGFR